MAGPRCVEELRALSEGRAIVFDTETTGLGSDDCVVEIGAVELRHGCATAALRVHGLTHQFLETAPPIDYALTEFLKWVGRETPLVGHNVAFDMRMLRQEVERLCEASERCSKASMSSSQGLAKDPGSILQRSPAASLAKDALDAVNTSVSQTSTVKSPESTSVSLESVGSGACNDSEAASSAGTSKPCPSKGVEDARNAMEAIDLDDSKPFGAEQQCTFSPSAREPESASSVLPAAQKKEAASAGVAAGEQQAPARASEAGEEREANAVPHIEEPRAAAGELDVDGVEAESLREVGLVDSSRDSDIKMSVWRKSQNFIRNMRTFCTKNCFRALFPGVGASLERHFSIDTSARQIHGALLDARLTAALFTALIRYVRGYGRTARGLALHGPCVEPVASVAHVDRVVVDCRTELRPEGSVTVNGLKIREKSSSASCESVTCGRTSASASGPLVLQRGESRGSQVAGRDPLNVLNSLCIDERSLLLEFFNTCSADQLVLASQPSVCACGLCGPRSISPSIRGSFTGADWCRGLRGCDAS